MANDSFFRCAMRATVHIELLAAMLALAVAGTGCDGRRLDFEKGAEDDGSKVTGVQSISVLKSLYNSGPTRIVQDLSIQGYIVANDDSGEFYKEVVVEDDTGGIVVSIDDDALYAVCPLFSFVTVNCRGLALGSEGGTLMLGIYPAGEYVVDRIPAAERNRYLSVTAAAARREPILLTFETLAPHHISRYVRFDNVRFADSGKTWCDRNPETGEPETTDRTLLDRNGTALTVRTDRRCDYAGKLLPKGEGTLCGIIEYFNGEYRLRVTNHEILFEE